MTGMSTGGGGISQYNYGYEVNVKNKNIEINVKNADCKNFIVFFIDTHFLSGFIEGTTIKISHSDVPDAPWYTLVHSSTL